MLFGFLSLVVENGERSTVGIPEIRGYPSHFIIGFLKIIENDESIFVTLVAYELYIILHITMIIKIG